MRALGLLLTATSLLLGSFVAGTASAQTQAIDQVEAKVPVTPVLSARRFPGALQSSSDPDLDAQINQYLSKVSGTTCAVVELDGRSVLRRNASAVLAPASVMKLATASAAIDLLGPDHVFTTTFRSDEPVKKGVIEGDLYVVGGGDPLFATPGYKTVFDDPDQFYEELSLLADALSDAGISQISGDLVGDDSRHENVRFLPSWPTRYQVGGTVAPLSALVVNDGSTGYTDTPNAATANRKAGDPPLLFVQTLKTILNERGIKVGGTALTGLAPESAQVVASFDSVPLNEVLSEMLLNSDNTTAELVLREIGRESKGAGTTSAGIEAVRESLTSQGYNLDGFVMVDGSGLDLGNRMSCELGLALATSVGSSDLSSSFPIGGRTGTLRKRMLQTASTGRVRAKTGTLNTVNALSGFADTPQGSTLTFTFFHNGNDSRATGVADGFTDRLMGYAKGMKFASLGPLPVK